MSSSGNQLWLDLRCDEGRVQVGIDVSFLSQRERRWLFEQLQKVHEGHTINFGAEEQDSGTNLNFQITPAPSTNVAPASTAAIQ